MLRFYSTKLAATREVQSSRRDPIVCGGEGVRLVAEWLKHSTANQKVAGSSLTIAIGDFLSLLGVGTSSTLEGGCEDGECTCEGGEG